MQRSLLFKILIILALAVLICLPISMIGHTVRERSDFRDQAVASVAQESVREQTVVGPVMVIHYTDAFDETVKNDKTGALELVPHAEERHLLVFPNTLTVGGTVTAKRRHRGIHQVLFYSGQYHLAGDFNIPAIASFPRNGPSSRLKITRTHLSVGVSDVRGIQEIPKVDWNGKEFEFEQGAAMNAMSSGLHADLDVAAMDQPTSAKFTFNFGLDGIESQHFSPVGKNNTFTLQSNWPHPQFGGMFLPLMEGRTMSDAGFRVTWRISSLATGAQRQLIDIEQASGEGDRALTKVDRFNVSFIEPINVYSLAERATKYGVLFVILTFAAFFVFEIMKSLRIHPVQYLLVGLALALFFLLLLSLSEQIAFIWAYLCASAACIVLIGFYLSFVLRDWRRGMGFGVALTVLYGALYGLLISESNALVLGSALLFTVLAAIMVVTRKVDWYQVGKVEA